MKITISFDGNRKSQDGKRTAFHKRPWFWLLIILIISAAVRLSSKLRYEIPFEVDGLSSVDIFSSPEEGVSEQEAEDDQIDYSGTEKTEKPEKTEEKGIFHFILNISTKKYHTRECSAAKKLSGEKRLDTDIEAENIDEAKKLMEAQGYGLCGICGK